MALQVINVGTAPNDGTGDPIRTAYIKCNDNFAEVYSRAQTTPPTSLIGSVGDQAGMYAYDSSFWYYCFANYDGVSTIWAQVAQIGNISVSSIASGTSSASFDNLNGNLVVKIGNTANVARFTTTGISATSNVTAANVNATNIYGSLATASQPNITSLGTLTSLDLSGALNSSANISTTGNAIASNLVASTAVFSSGNVTATSNVLGGNVVATSLVQSSTISATGNIITDGYFVGTFFGNITGNFTVPGGNTQVIFNTAGNADAVSNFTFNKATNVLQVTGNVSTGNVLATTTSASGNITGGNYLTGGLLSATGNVTGGNILTTGIISASGNIASGGNITGIANITGGNILTSGIVSGASHIGSMVSVSGNVTGGNLVGGGVSAVSNVTGANLNITTAFITGNATVGNISIVGNVIGDINANGNISSGNLVVTTTINAANYIGSTMSVTANVTAGNVLSNGLISATGNITGGNLIAGTTTIGNGITTTSLSASGNVTAGNVLFGSGIVSGTGNITGGNVLGGTTVSASSHIGSVVSVSGNITGGNVLFGSGIVSGTGNITGGNLSVSTGSITLGSIVNANSNGVGNIGSSTGYFNTVFAKATSAQYADLAEKYLADAPYEPGTVVVIGGSAEVTKSNQDYDRAVAGVVSTQPAYIMNSGLAGDNVVTVALIGRVPCRVRGPVARGDLLVSTVDGYARSSQDPKIGSVIGKALESFDGKTGIIEIVVGKL